MDLTLRVVGWVESPLRDKDTAPKMEDEDAPRAIIRLDPACLDALDGLEAGQRVELFTWLHLADRDCLQVHPRGDVSRPRRGVFATRSPDRPNPVGVHVVTLMNMDLDAARPTLTVDALEALDGTPVIDIKPLRGGGRS